MSKDEKIKEFLTNVLTKAEGNLIYSSTVSHWMFIYC